MIDPFQAGYEFQQRAVRKNFADNALSRYAGGDKAAVNDLMRFDPEQAMRLQDQERQNVLFDQGQQDRQRQEQMMQQRQQLGQQAAGGDLEGARQGALTGGDFEGAEMLGEWLQTANEQEKAQAKAEAGNMANFVMALDQVGTPEQQYQYVMQSPQLAQQAGIDPSGLELEDFTPEAKRLILGQFLGTQQMIENDLAQRKMQMTEQYNEGRLDLQGQRVQQQGANTQSIIAKRNQPKAVSGGRGAGGGIGTNEDPPDMR